MAIKEQAHYNNWGQENSEQKHVSEDTKYLSYEEFILRRLKFCIKLDTYFLSLNFW